MAATSDMHGTLGIFCDFDCDQVKGLLHLVPVIKELRVRDPQMLLLDGGDTYQGKHDAVLPQSCSTLSSISGPFATIDEQTKI